MKFSLAVSICAVTCSFAQEPITFTNRVTSFSDLQGNSYERVELIRADRDSLLWRKGASGGRVYFTNLAPDVFQYFGLSNRVEVAQATMPVKPEAAQSVSATPAPERKPDRSGTWTLVVVAIGLCLFARLILSPGRRCCDVCGTLLKRTAYVWKIDGRKQRVCPKCSRRLEERMSKEAVQRLGG